MNELLDYSIRKIRAHVKADPRAATAIDVRFRDKARADNPKSHAFITIADDEVDYRPANRIDGRLAGVPFACKDVFNTKSMPTTAGSRVLTDNRPVNDAVAVQRLLSAGATLVGKANMHEFCYGITGENRVYGTPPNPYDATRIAGGSSSGSAVSTATGTAVFSIGSDTGGSIRVPAALCGLVGMKPTYGLISTKGMIPFCWTLDHVGFMTRSVVDAAAVLEVLAGWDDETDADGSTRLERRLIAQGTSMLKGVRIGVPRRHFYERLDTEIGDAIERVLQTYRAFGAVLVEVTTPTMEYVRPASLAIQLAEAISAHGSRLKDKSDLYGDDVLRGLVQGQFILAEQYVQSLRLSKECDKNMRSSSGKSTFWLHPQHRSLRRR